jgi:hypothetical protein
LCGLLLSFDDDDLVSIWCALFESLSDLLQIFAARGARMAAQRNSGDTDDKIL